MNPLLSTVRTFPWGKLTKHGRLGVIFFTWGLSAGTLSKDDFESLDICSPLLPSHCLPSPDTTTMLSAEECDRILSGIEEDCGQLLTVIGSQEQLRDDEEEVGKQSRDASALVEVLERFTVQKKKSRNHGFLPSLSTCPCPRVCSFLIPRFA